MTDAGNEDLDGTVNDIMASMLEAAEDSMPRLSGNCRTAN